jgi:hypothetical protein
VKLALYIMLRQLSLVQTTDLSKEAQEQTAGRLLEFLKIIKYKPTSDP